jgi:gliding motility-associated-like protein
MISLSKKLFSASLVALLLLLSGKANAQCGPLATPTVTNNGQDGIMFDVVAITNVNLTQIAMDFDSGNHTIQIYGKTGTHVGFTTNAAAWTLLGTANAWAATGGTNVTIPITFSKVLCPGQVYAFYVTSTTGGCNYSNGTAVGANAAIDANIRILQGTGKDFSFGANFTPRTPNVKVFYSCLTGCCVPPTMTFTQETCVGSCNGTATATVGAGGIGPYTYLWNAAAGNQTTQTATGLCAGTYTVSVTDGAGCVSTGTVTVTSGAASANAAITPSGPYCQTAAAVTLTAATAGGTWTGTGITNAATGVFDPSVAGVGTHTITYTIAGPCGDVETTTITVNPNANATITPVGPYCLGDAAVTLTAVTAGGTWSGIGITNTTTGVFDPSVAGLGTHTITYTIAGPCGDVETTTITVNPNADATITPVGPYCISDPSLTLSAVTAGGTWSGTGITNATSGTFDPAIAGAGIHTITYTISGACGDVATTTIEVNTAYNATITPVGPYCETDPSVTLSAVDPSGTWSGTGITNATTGTFDPAVAGPGTHTITYTIAGACGDTKTTSITVNQSYDATITAAGPFCELDAAVTLTAVDAGGTWSGTGITNATTGTFDPLVAGPGTHTITYTIAGACGDIQTTTIVVNQSYDATITAVGPYCQSDAAVTLSAVDGGGTWSGAGITNATTGTFDPAIAGTGVHTITYTIVATCGDIQTTSITVNQTYNATITPAGPFCGSDTPVNLSAVDAGGVWSGTGITNTTNGTFDPAVAGPGTHTITYTISGACGDTQTTDILVNASGDATITAVGPFCLGAPLTTLSAVTAGGSWTGAGITNATTGEFNATLAGSGLHTITYTTNGPCPDVSTTDIQVYDELTVQASQNLTICAGETVTISAIGSGGDGNLTYTWTDQLGNPVGTGMSLTVTPLVTTTYIVTLTDGCTTPQVIDDVKIIVNPIPSINISANNLVGCTPLEVVFTNTNASAGSTCLWDFGNGATSTSCGTDSTQYTASGCYDVTLTVTQNGCSNSQTIPDFVCASEVPVAEFVASPDQTDILDTEIEFTNYSINSDDYLWTFGDETTSGESDPTHEYSTVPAGYTVCLIASNAAGCVDTTCHGVNITETLIYYIPNTFTPDGDEFNQAFQPIFTSGFDPFNFNFKIYNRWGEVIWETNDPTVGWDGVGPNGKLVQSGTYVWRVEFKSRENDDRHVANGHLNVLR